MERRHDKMWLLKEFMHSNDECCWIFISAVQPSLDVLCIFISVIFLCHCRTKKLPHLISKLNMKLISFLGRSTWTSDKLHVLPKSNLGGEGVKGKPESRGMFSVCIWTRWGLNCTVFDFQYLHLLFFSLNHYKSPSGDTWTVSRGARQAPQCLFWEKKEVEDQMGCYAFGISQPDAEPHRCSVQWESGVS